MRDLYGSFSELRARQREGINFDRVLLMRPAAQVVVLAPHGGRLENHTDEIAEAVAAADYGKAGTSSIEMKLCRYFVQTSADPIDALSRTRYKCLHHASNLVQSTPNVRRRSAEAVH